MPKSGEIKKVLVELDEGYNAWGRAQTDPLLWDAGFRLRVLRAYPALRSHIEAQAAEIARLREALSDATAHLAGAASAYRLYASRNKFLKPRAISDALFTTRATDIDNAVERARAALQHKPTETHYDLDG